MTTPKLRSRAHIHINKFISLSLPLDEIWDGIAAIGRRAMVAVRHPSRDRNIRTRLDPALAAKAAIDDREAVLADTEKTLVGLGFKKAQARAAIDTIRPDVLGKESHEVVAAALKATQPPEAK